MVPFSGSLDKIERILPSPKRSLLRTPKSEVTISSPSSNKSKPSSKALF